MDLKTLAVRYRNYAESANPPILHRKETFLAPEDPRRPKFERLTAQEERWGLYGESTRIGWQERWEELLRRKGVKLRGHRLVRVRPRK